MILTDWQIKKQIDDGNIGLSPYEESLVNPSSLDFRLGKYYTTTKPVNYNYFDPITGEITCACCINPLDPKTFVSETVEKEKYWLKPQESVLVSMYERLRLPDNVSGRVLGKSSLARLGLDNSSGAAWLDPGFEGYVTLELTNHSKYAIQLTHGMRIGQIVFYKHEPVTRSYNFTGRYHNQQAGQGSKGIV